MYHINRSYRIYPTLLQRSTVITSKNHRFSPQRAKDIIPIISGLVMSQLDELHSIFSTVLQKDKLEQVQRSATGIEAILERHIKMERLFLKN